MDLLEYQAKKLFRQIGIPVPPSETIAEPRELKQLQIPYPVVLKSQVRAGGRGKAGGVKFVANTIDAIAAARTIFNLSILEEYPEVILAEAHYNATKELFLGIVLDYQQQRPVLFGSIHGGMDVDLLRENLQQVVVEAEFSPFLARRLTSLMGLSGELLLSVSEVIGKMYELFQTKNLDLIEINPLGVDAASNLMALDGKISVSQYALTKDREPVSSNTLQIEKNSQMTPSWFSFAFNSQATSHFESPTNTIRWLDWQNEKGTVAIVTNDNELAFLCWDLIGQKHEQPACAVVISVAEFSLQLLEQQLRQIHLKLDLQKTLKVLLINFCGREEQNSLIAKAIIELFKPSSKSIVSTRGEERNIVPANGSTAHIRRSQIENIPQTEPKLAELTRVKLVVRLATTNIEQYQQEFAHERIFWTNNLEESIEKVISWSKTK